jgi:hypothetical protein
MRAVFVISKKNSKVSGYTSLEAFFEVHPEYMELKNSINYYLSQKKTHFENENIILYRISIKGRKKKKKKLLV